ncbi:DUF7537 family lipoprotein [Halobacterium wangiae]|uniref:DUF7537 family lipoprotein n=1 Tax=Halobacterium wangiae TaxID=2902623 RepID=UPI001E63C60A|nr:hypothetical protein [Halobacterium wangiae]
MRREIVTLAVVALLVVAGCSSGGGDTTTTPAYDTEAEPVYETPLDTETVTDAHVDALRDHGTFTVDVNATWRHGSSERVRREILVRGNLDTGAVYEHQAARGDVQQTYRFGNGTAYARFVSSGEVSYDSVTRGVGNATTYASGNLWGALELFTFDYAGTRAVDGERVHVYRADSLDRSGEFDPSNLGGGENVTVNRAEATLQFREDGTLRHADYTLQFESDGESQLTSVDLHVQRLGDTDVSPPRWIPDARNATE